MLVVEDEPYLAEAVRDGLRLEAIAADIAGDGDTALELLSVNAYDIAVLDRDIPGPSGDEIAKSIVASGSGMPILMLTAADRLDDKASGFELGADDYLTKPFSMSELLARLRALLRRIRPSLADDVVQVGDIEIDRAAHRVRRGGVEVHLGPTEYRLLDHLIQHPGRVFSREQLLDAVWGSDVYVEARTVDVHVGRLRKALNVEGASDPIRTVRSAGYSLDESVLVQARRANA